MDACLVLVLSHKIMSSNSPWLLYLSLLNVLIITFAKLNSVNSWLPAQQSETWDQFVWDWRGVKPSAVLLPVAERGQLSALCSGILYSEWSKMELITPINTHYSHSTECVLCPLFFHLLEFRFLLLSSAETHLSYVVFSLGSKCLYVNVRSVKHIDNLEHPWRIYKDSVLFWS